MAFPSDVKAERDRLPKIVDKVNRTFDNFSTVSQTRVVLTLHAWDTDAYPGLNINGPQAQAYLGIRLEQCDFLIVILWRKLGTPVDDAPSGTVHEFRRALALWEEGRRPQVLLYFKECAAKPASSQDMEHWTEVVKFKESLVQKYKGLFWSFTDEVDFDDLVFEHLHKHICTQIFADVERQLSPTLSHPWCSVWANSHPLRGEGLTELLGDICLEVRPGVEEFVRSDEYLDLQISFNTSITSRLPYDKRCDACLVISSSLSGVANVEMNGELLGTNSLVFRNISLQQFPADAILLFRLTKIRVNANALLEGNIFARISVHKSNGQNPLFASALSVGTLRRSLSFGIFQTTHEQDPPIQQAIQNLLGEKGRTSPHAKSVSIVRDVEFVERFPGAFMQIGTQFRLSFWNIPCGVRLFVYACELSNEATYVRVTPSSGRPMDVDLTSLNELQVTADTAGAAWGLESFKPDSTGRLNRLRITIVAIAQDAAELGVVIVYGTYGPISTATTATTGPIPRFADISEGLPIFAVGPRPASGESSAA